MKKNSTPAQICAENIVSNKNDTKKTTQIYAEAFIFTENDTTFTTMDLRKKIGLTQPQLADYLGITRSQLHMYERGERSLPIPVLIKLGTLETVVEKHMERKRKPMPAHVKTQAEHAHKKLQKHMAFHHAKALTAELRLEAMQQQYAQHSLLLEILENTKDTHTDSKDKLWHSMTKRTAEKSIEKNSLHAQHMLHLRLEGHRHQYALAKEKVEALGKLK